MTRDSRRRKFRWLRHVAWVLLINLLVVLAVAIFFFGSGLGNPLIRRIVVRRLEEATGGRVEMRTVSVGWLSLRATIKGLVVHGLEPPGTEPLFSSEEVQAGVRIDSLWGRKISLEALLVRQPRVHIRVGKNGVTNVPTPRRPRAPKK